MSEKGNIEQLFKDKFESFQPKVDAGAWTSIQSNLGSGVVSSSTPVITSVVMAVASVFGVISVNQVVTNHSDNTEFQSKKPIVLEANVASNNVLPKETLVLSNEEFVEKLEKAAEKDQTVLKHIEEIKKESFVSNEQIEVIEDIFQKPINEITPTEIVIESVVENKEDSDRLVEENKSTSRETSFSLDWNIDAFDFQQINFLSHAENVDKIDWNFGDDTYSQELNPAHYYEEPGTYDVVLTVNGDQVKTQKILVYPPSEISNVPNVFTPDGDYINDEYFISSKGLKEFYLVVIDQQGKLVYETKDADFKWSGTDSFGNNLAVGSYMCVIKAVGFDGVKHNRSERIYIKR